MQKSDNKRHIYESFFAETQFVFPAPHVESFRSKNSVLGKKFKYYGNYLNFLQFPNSKMKRNPKYYTLQDFQEGRRFDSSFDVYLVKFIFAGTF